MQGVVLFEKLITQAQAVPALVVGREHGLQRDGGHLAAPQDVQKCLQQLAGEIHHHQHFLTETVAAVFGGDSAS